ncbi:MAG TPA: capsule assembly Wzi family protein, partial [Bacteroidales bacterium]
MNLLRNPILLFSFLLITVFVNGQVVKDLKYSVESSGSFSMGEQTPFWLLSNRQGLSSIEKNNAYLRIGLFRPYERRQDFTYAYGFDLATAAKYTSSFIVQQAYLDLHYQALVLSLGSKERWSEMENQQLSSGGLTYSGNARPIPQARIGFPEYVSVPYTNNWLKVRGHVAYGA